MPPQKCYAIFGSRVPRPGALGDAEPKRASGMSVSGHAPAQGKICGMLAIAPKQPM